MVPVSGKEAVTLFPVCKYSDVVYNMKVGYYDCECVCVTQHTHIGCHCTT